MNTESLTFTLKLAAAGQLILAVLDLFIGRILGWKAAMDRMPLLVREVFQIQGWFIALTLFIFGVLTWCFAADMAGGAHVFLRWFSGGIGLFWGLRCVMQWAHYSAVHWRGIPHLTVIHWTLFLSYVAFTLTYWKAALG
ncbi:hypothetical protein [Prosthecobacter sp.]|uniref:hypothetical protein n=1 Tax=Prosthecobacter sp. TaxID=1965333 RepID=UPI003783347C